MAKEGIMKAVIFKEPHKVAIEDRPIPKIKEPTGHPCESDRHCIVWKVSLMHDSLYRRAENSNAPFLANCMSSEAINPARLASSWLGWCAILLPQTVDLATGPRVHWNSRGDRV